MLVHERGMPHMADPAKLLASAERLYGDQMERLWGEVAPVPARNLHPLSGGEDGHGWPFGGPILYSRVVQRVLAVPGVDSIRRLVIAIDGEEGPECRDLQIRDGALVYSTEHEVSVGYAVATGGAP